MSDWKEHVKDCQKQLGNGWDVVHHWLDEYAGVYFPWMGHRIHRHHREGIEEARSKWGDEAAKAAEIHILRDEGKIYGRREIEKLYGIKDQQENIKENK